MLTDAKIKSLRPRDALYRVADSAGLCLEVAQRLAMTAEDLESAAIDAGDLPRAAHVARGHLALVAEARRVIASHRPDAELAQVDWPRMDAIREGIRRLEGLADAELREEIRHDLRTHEQYRRDMIALGMGDYIAEKVDADSALQRALRTMRKFVRADEAS